MRGEKHDPIDISWKCTVHIIIYILYINIGLQYEEPVCSRVRMKVFPELALFYRIFHRLPEYDSKHNMSVHHVYAGMHGCRLWCIQSHMAANSAADVINNFSV